MQPTNDKHTVMHQLLEVALFVGTRPMPEEAPEDYGRRMLLDIDSRIEFLDDDLRFRILALLNLRVS